MESHFDFILPEKISSLSIGEVREIIPYCWVTPIPDTEPWIEGALILEGSLKIVIDMNVMSGLEPIGYKGQFIITTFKDMDIALHIDTGGRNVTMKFETSFL